MKNFLIICVCVLIAGILIGCTNKDKNMEITSNEKNSINDNSISSSEVAWNQPKLDKGLIPVNWNGTNWEKVSEAEWEYDYNSVATEKQNKIEGNGNGKWANAQTEDGSLYVWIPRYSYKIVSGEHKNVNSWNGSVQKGNSKNAGKIEIKFSKGNLDDLSDGYISHPAFSFGDDELDGIWVAKFEASRNDATNTNEGTGTMVVSKPNVISWRNITIGEMFEYAYNLNRNLDSHMMKNSEWGAVAYLTNAIGCIPYINNSSSYITGNAGTSQDALTVDGIANAWNTSNGVKASTTHNIYGIYDMSGGADEYVAAYVDNDELRLSGEGDKLVNAKEKYKDVYPTGSSDSMSSNYKAWSKIKGDAMYETSTGSGETSAWDGDYSSIAGMGVPCISRGSCGSYNGASTVGIFSYFADNGGAYASCGFRTVLVVK